MIDSFPSIALVARHIWGTGHPLNVSYYVTFDAAIRYTAEVTAVEWMQRSFRPFLILTSELLASHCRTHNGWLVGVTGTLIRYGRRLSILYTSTENSYTNTIFFTTVSDQFYNDAASMSLKPLSLTTANTATRKNIIISIIKSPDADSQALW